MVVYSEQSPNYVFLTFESTSPTTEVMLIQVISQMPSGVPSAEWTLYIHPPGTGVLVLRVFRYEVNPVVVV